MDRSCAVVAAGKVSSIVGTPSRPPACGRDRCLRGCGRARLEGSRDAGRLVASSGRQPRVSRAWLRHSGPVSSRRSIGNDATCGSGRRSRTRRPRGPEFPRIAAASSPPRCGRRSGRGAAARRRSAGRARPPTEARASSVMLRPRCAGARCGTGRGTGCSGKTRQHTFDQSQGCALGSERFRAVTQNFAGPEAS